MKISDNISLILNNPYEEPKWHYDVTLDGNLDYSKILAGRRPCAANLTVVPNATPNKAIFSAEDIFLDDENANFINGIKQVVKEWREQGYPKVTRTARDFLESWSSTPERELSESLFFCQREAVETAIYLNEVSPCDPNWGRSILHELEMCSQTVSDQYEDVLPCTEFKMATGIGKTVVMAMLILYVNKKEPPHDTCFANHFLIVAPGITICDRHGVLYIDMSGKSAYDKLDYYHQRELIPEKYVRLFGGLNSVTTITNYHQFEPRVYTGKKLSPFDWKLKYEDGKMVKQKDKEEFTSVLSRLIAKRAGRKITVRVISQFGEASTKVLPIE